jgi:hypothetical protein
MVYLVAHAEHVSDFDVGSVEPSLAPRRQSARVIVPTGVFGLHWTACVRLRV